MSNNPKSKSKSGASGSTGDQGALGDLNTFFGLAQEMLCIVGTDGFLNRVNPSFTRALGWSDAALQTQLFLDLVHPEDRAATDAVISSLAEGKSTASFENRFLTTEGDYRSLSWSVGADESGLIYATGHDLSEALAAAEKLHQSEERYQAILGGIEDAYYEIDLVGTLLSFSDPLVEVFGFSEEELKGKTIQAFTDLDTANELSAVFERVLQTGNPVSGFAWELMRKDGTRRQIESSITLRRDENGQPAGFRGISRDITRRRLAEVRLARQAAELETVIQVGLRTANILDPDELLQVATDLTQANFDLYKVHIFLLDGKGETLVTRAGSGVAGPGISLDNVTIPLAQEGSIVAKVARSLEGLIVPDVRKSPDYLALEQLDDTRSEMAVPLAIRDELIGVLDLQSDEVGHFADADLRLMSTLAAQLAGAIHNARSFTRSESARRELDELTQRLTREGWNKFLATKTPESLHVTYEAGVDPDQPTSVVATGTGQITLVQPLTVQGHAVGELALSEPNMAPEEAAEVIDAVIARLTAHLENLRLTDQAERALAESRILYEASANLNAAGTLEETLAAIIGPAQANGANRATLWRLESDDFGRPEWQIMAALWEARPSTVVTTARRVRVDSLPLAQAWLDSPLDPLLIDDVVKDNRLDVDSLEAMAMLDVRATVYLPLVIGRRWVGMVNIGWDMPQAFGEEDRNLYRSLAAQAAVAFENQTLLRQTEARARQERLLRQVTEKVRGSSDIDTIMRTAVREVGRALGRQAFVYLDSADGQTE